MLYYSAGIIPVVIEKAKPRFLMLRVYSTWDFPKGKVDEDDDSMIETALREMEEESGIKEVHFTWGLDFIETPPYKTKVNGKKARKISRYYLGEYISGAIQLLPNPETGIIEHHEFRWVTYDEAVELNLSDRIQKVLDWAMKKIYAK